MPHYECPPLALTPAQVNFLIDVMMDANPNMVNLSAKRNQVDDVNVMYLLDKCLDEKVLVS